MEPSDHQGSGKPEVSPDGRTFTYAIPVDTWGGGRAVPRDKAGFHVDCPEIRALVPDVWKRVEIEIEWGFDQATIRPRPRRKHRQPMTGSWAMSSAAGDDGTVMTGPFVAFGGQSEGRAGCG